jgi:hypothetical protein
VQPLGYQITLTGIGQFDPEPVFPYLVKCHAIWVESQGGGAERGERNGGGTPRACFVG